MRVLLDHGANVHALPHGEELDEEGRLPRGDSPLHYSAINGSVACVDMLIALHADVNRRSARYGETPLHKAVLFGRSQVAGQLIEAGAALHVKNDRGFSAVKLCELCGGAEMRAVFAERVSSPLQPVTPDYIRSHFASLACERTERLAAEGEKLLWDLVVALYLYKRPRRARALLVDCLLAAYQTGLPGPPLVSPPSFSARAPARMLPHPSETLNPHPPQSQALPARPPSRLAPSSLSMQPRLGRSNVKHGV